MIYQGEIEYKKIIHIYNFFKSHTKMHGNVIVIAFGITHLEAEHNILDVSSDISLDATYLINKYD